MELHVRAQKENVTSTLSVDKLCLPALEQGGGDAAERDTKLAHKALGAQGIGKALPPSLAAHGDLGVKNRVNFVWTPHVTLQSLFDF